jgi:hypothetical protein
MEVAMNKVVKLFSLLSVFLISIFMGCQQDVNSPLDNQQTPPGNLTISPKTALVTTNDNLPLQTHLQLQAAKAATAKYHDINKAIEDGYVDIDVVVQNMGYHYMKPSNIDGTFNPAKPPILVYSKNPETGKMKLVAVEYAIPNTDPRPEGFTGDSDVWENNTDFGLWLCHAWVWYNNPDGIFNEFNPRVHVSESDITYQ